MRFCMATVYSYAAKTYGGDKFYDMRADTGITNTEIGLLEGLPVFSVPFAIGLIVAGPVSDKYNRAKIITVCCIMWSLMNVLGAVGNSFIGEMFPRMFLGFFEAFCSPPAYGLIADYFPKDMIASANAVYILGFYFGQALSTLSTVFIDWFGWKGTFAFIGAIGVVVGLISLLIIVEPPRGKQDNLKKSSFLATAAKQAKRNRLQ